MILHLSCNGQTNKNKSAVPKQNQPISSINWSSAAPEDVWDNIFKLYDSEGARQALVILDTAIEKGVISTVEAEQVRAGFLFDLGRLDDAFMALTGYKLDESRPDLLMLRADILWGMGRFEEAKRDYDTIFNHFNDRTSPDVLANLVRLNDDLGNWSSAAEIYDQLKKFHPDSVEILELDFMNAIQSSNPQMIENAITALKNYQKAKPETLNALIFQGEATLKILNGKMNEAKEEIRKFISDNGFNLSLALILLRIDVETNDFVGFENDLISFFKLLDAIEFFEGSQDTIPKIVDNPIEVAYLLDWASTCELGKGNFNKAILFADRAFMLYPYDINCLQQKGIIQIVKQDIKEGFNSLNDALKIAPLSDIRIRVRLLQLSHLAGKDVPIPWNNDAIVLEITNIINYRKQQHPENALINMAEAEIKAYRGNIAGAVNSMKKACSFPDANRDMYLRLAYYLVRSGKPEEAWEIIVQHLPPESPYLHWAKIILQEAIVKSDSKLRNFAERVREHLDPSNSHSDFFELENNLE